MTEASAHPSPDPSVLHRERLLPSVGTWVVLVALGALMGVILVPLSTTLSIVVGIAGIVIMCAVGVLWSPVIEVTREHLVAGRARIEVGVLEEPEALVGADWQKVMSTGFEPLAFHCTRGWVRSGVRVALDDPDDPTPAWVISTRRPQDVVLALQVARSAA